MGLTIRQKEPKVLGTPLGRFPSMMSFKIFLYYLFLSKNLVQRAVRRCLPNEFKSFREKKLHLKAELPVGATLPGLHNVGIGCQLSINRQLAEPEKLANTATDRHDPTVVAGSQPVRCDDRR
jgi:hypothetical protein